MTTAATYDYIASDFADAAETLGEYRTRTSRPTHKSFVGRAYRRITRAL
jgi:hypothetical protein